jgi:hypothetical protein
VEMQLDLGKAAEPGGDIDFSRRRFSCHGLV